MLIRACILIDDPPLAERLERVLRQPDVLARRPRPEGDGADLWACLEEDVCDLVVATRTVVPEPYSAAVAEVRALAEEPELVVLAEEGDAEGRAALQAAGVFAVVAADLAESSLRKALNTLIRRRREALLRRHRADDRQTATTELLESRSPAMRELLELARRVTASDTSLLILGETGVGKEWLARRIHEQGPRAAGPFVAVNCAALPAELIESELFGHTEGAFTGAGRPRRGEFEVAHSGTLFLDEVAEMPAAAQAKLLRAVQDRQIRRLGSEAPIDVDVRIVGATNRDPERAMRDGRLREDLYYRLGVVSLVVPPLRERVDDLPRLVEELLVSLRRRVHRPDVRNVSSAAMERLQAYPWPGNVRELINVLERSVLLAAGAEVTVNDLPAAVTGAAGPPGRGGRGSLAGTWRDLLDTPLAEAKEELLELFERDYLTRLLRETAGAVGETARRAGVDERTIYNKMRRYGLDKESFRSGAG